MTRPARCKSITRSIPWPFPKRAAAAERCREAGTRLPESHTPASLHISHLGSTNSSSPEPGCQCTSHIHSVGTPLLHPQGCVSPSCWVLDLARRDTQELTRLWLFRSPDMESSRGCGEEKEERGKKGLIVREPRVGNFMGCPEQSLEETQALSTAPPTPRVIYGLETTLEKQTLLSPARCAPLSRGTASLSHGLTTSSPRMPCPAQELGFPITVERGNSSLQPTPHSCPSSLWHCHLLCCPFNSLTWQQPSPSKVLPLD